MSKTKQKLDTTNPPIEYEISIWEAEDVIMALHDAIAIAKEGRRADILIMGESRVAIPSRFKGENTDVEVSVCPEHLLPALKLVKK